jgi:acyl carrier protein
VTSPTEEAARLDEIVRDALSKHGHLGVDVASLAADDDLYVVGLTSHATINVMIAVEDAIGVQFPEYLLRRATFVSIDAIAHAATESARLH